MIVNLVVFKHRVFFTSTLQLSLIPNNQTYSGDRELTQYFIRWTWWQKMINSHDSWKKITPAFRKTSMQLTEDNSTISVKVNVFSYYCCRLKRENLENLKYPQIWNPARVLHFYVFFASLHRFNDIPRLSLADDFWVFSWLSTCPPSWWTLWDTLQCTSNHSSLRPRLFYTDS